MPTPDIDIGELRKLMERTTPAPWSISGQCTDYERSDGEMIVSTDPEEGVIVQIAALYERSSQSAHAPLPKQAFSNGLLICLLRNAAPALLAAAEECDSLKYDNANLRTSNELLTDLEIDLRAEIAALKSRLAQAEAVVSAVRASLHETEMMNSWTARQILTSALSTYEGKSQT